MIRDPGVAGGVPVAQRMTGAGADHQQRLLVRHVLLDPLFCIRCDRQVPKRSFHLDAERPGKLEETLDLVLERHGCDRAVGEPVMKIPGPAPVPAKADRRPDQAAQQVSACGHLHVQQDLEAPVTQRLSEAPDRVPAAFLVEFDELDPFHAFQQSPLELADDPGDPCFRPMLLDGANSRQRMCGVTERGEPQQAQGFGLMVEWQQWSVPIDAVTGRQHNTRE